MGFARFFCFWAASMDATIARIWQLAAPLAETQGMEIIDIEFRHEGSRGGRVLRLYLDKPGGPNVDDLSRMSRDLSGLVDADEVVDGTYTLEVSADKIALNQDGTRCEIPFTLIEKSNYEHDWSAEYAAGSK